MDASEKKRPLIKICEGSNARLTTNCCDALSGNLSQLKLDGNLEYFSWKYMEIVKPLGLNLKILLSPAGIVDGVLYDMNCSGGTYF